MPEGELISEIRAVDWHGLESTYGSGEVVRDIVLGLVSRDELDVRRAWREIGGNPPWQTWPRSQAAGVDDPRCRM